MAAAIHHHLLLFPPRLLPGRPQPPRLRLPSRTRPLRAAAPTDAALQEFRRWVSSHGADAGGGAATPAAVPEGGLGLVAARDLPRGEVLAEVPKKLWMDADAVAASDIGVAIGGAELRPWVAVALLLLREAARGADSPWEPYLAILPRQTDSTIFWSEEELLEIQGTQLLSTTMGVKEYVQSEFESVEAEIISENRETAYFDIVLGESLPPQMLPYLRLLCLGGTDVFLLEALFRNAVWGHLELPVSQDNEEAICQVIRNACKSALGAYHTTVEEDQDLPSQIHD